MYGTVPYSWWFHPVSVRILIDFIICSDAVMLPFPTTFALLCHVPRQLLPLLLLLLLLLNCRWRVITAVVVPVLGLVGLDVIP